MRRWLRLTLVRVILAVIVGLLIIESLVWYPSQTARGLVISQIDLTQTAMQRVKVADSLLDYLPDLSTIQLRQPNEAKGYAQQAAQASNGFKQLSLSRPQPVKSILGIDINRKSPLIAQVNNLIVHKDFYTYRTANADIMQADRLMLYHQKVSEALVNLLEYDASKDMAGFSLKTEDSQTRINLAKQGLTKTVQQLQTAQNLYGDPSLSDISARINSLLSALQALAQNGDTKAWIAAADDAQVKVVANRRTFWNSHKQVMQSRLDQDQSRLLKLNTDWRRIAVQNNL